MITPKQKTILLVEDEAVAHLTIDDTIAHDIEDFIKLHLDLLDLHSIQSVLLLPILKPTLI